MFLTGGLYIFVWAYFMRRACAAILEQDDQPIWKSVALLVPIFNFFLMFDLGKKIQGVEWRADPSRVNGSLPWLGVSVFGFHVLGGLSGGYSYLGYLNFLPITWMHRQFSRAQIALLGASAAPTRLRWPEWGALVIGGVLWIDGTVTVLTRKNEAIAAGYRSWFLGALILSVALLALSFVASRRATADGLAMNADPSPDRIAPGH